MDENSRLDGFLIHPVDLVPHNKNNFGNLDKVDLNTANLDGYNVHPVDLFVSNDNNNNNFNINKNNAPNFPNYNNTPTNNITGLFPYKQNLENANLYNQNQNFRGSYEPIVQNNHFVDNNISLNNVQTTTKNINTYQNYNQLIIMKFHILIILI